MPGFGKSRSAAEETGHVFSEHRTSLLRYLRYHLRDADEAEDIVQDVFIRFFQARESGEEITQPRAWLYRVAHNLLVDFGRKRKPELLDEQGWMLLESRLTSTNGSLDARVHVSQLPWKKLTATELDCLRLRAEGLKFREIGEVLNLSISTVVSYISRAVTKLKGNENEPSESPKHGRAPAVL